MLFCSLIGALVGALIGLAIIFFTKDHETIEFLPGGLAGLTFGALIGCIIGLKFFV